MHSTYCVCVALFVSVVKPVSGSHFDLTVTIPPRESECFYQTIMNGIPVEIYYEVIEGGDLDINTQVMGPSDVILHNDQRKRENDIEFTSKVTGDFRLCFDNSFSSFSTKVVFFEVFIDDGVGEGRNGDGDDDDDDDEEKMMDAMTFEGEGVENELSITAREFIEIMDRAKKHLERSVQLQHLKLIGEAKDRHTQEKNLWRVNHFSVVQVLVMIGTAVTQVMLIRRLFSSTKPTSGAFRART